MMRLDGIDQKLLNLLQAKFPLTGAPYADLGLSLGIAEQEAIRRIEQLKARGFIRQIGPVFNAASLGYRTTLVAMRVAEARLDKAAELISNHPGVSHVYERDHHFNLWFTLAVPATIEMEAELQRLAGPIKAETVFTLPALRLFKLRAYFGSDVDRQSVMDAEASGGIIPQEARLSPADTALWRGRKSPKSRFCRQRHDLLGRTPGEGSGCRSEAGVMARSKPLLRKKDKPALAIQPFCYDSRSYRRSVPGNSR